MQGGFGSRFAVVLSESATRTANRVAQGAFFVMAQPAPIRAPHFAFASRLARYYRVPLDEIAEAALRGELDGFRVCTHWCITLNDNLKAWLRPRTARPL